MRHLLSLIFLFCSPLSAKEARSITIRTLCLEHVDGLKTLYFKSSEKTGEVIAIPIWERGLSDDIRLNVSGDELLFYAPVQEGDGKKEDPVARGKASSEARQLLFFVPEKRSGLSYRVISYNDDTRTFPMGSTRLLNVSHSTAHFKLGEIEKAVEPGATTIAPMPRMLNRFKDYNLMIELESDKGRYLVRQTRGKSSKRKRDMAVVYIDADSKRARVKL